MTSGEASRRSSRPYRVACVVLLAALNFPPVALPEVRPPSAPPPPTASNALSRPARDWARQAAKNEAEDVLEHTTFFRYRVHILDQRGDRTRDVIEAREGTVSRTILRNGQPLSADENNAEQARLTDMLESPSVFSRHLKNDAEGKKLAVDLVRLMPDAMDFTYVPGQPQTSTAPTASSPSLPQIVLDYAPNPQWKPPTTTSEALTGLRGRMWIDPATGQLLRMEGEIFQGINLGWGMLAHIYPGGRLVLEQADQGGGRWIYTHFAEQASVRALMVKSVSVHTTVDASLFERLPGPISYTDAIRRLLSEPLPTR